MPATPYSPHIEALYGLTLNETTAPLVIAAAHHWARTVALNLEDRTQTVEDIAAVDPEGLRVLAAAYLSLSRHMGKRVRKIKGKVQFEGILRVSYPALDGGTHIVVELVNENGNGAGLQHIYLPDQFKEVKDPA